VIRLPTCFVPFWWVAAFTDDAVYPGWQSPHERLRWLERVCCPVDGGAPWQEVQLWLTSTRPLRWVVAFAVVAV
jgi:hypothetical protein